MIGRRLDRLSDWLGARQWLEGEFTAGDLLMVDVLRIAQSNQVLTQPNLVDYVARGTARAAFQRAHAAQLADFDAVSEGVM
jgi:glutathione S-transferase